MVNQTGLPNMKINKIILIILLITTSVLKAQVVLTANGSGDTYELINSVFALPNKDVVEVPDCVHTDFGRHIDEVFDTDLNKNVFRFFAHVSPDNDRCKTFDRQRTEIKSFNSSPENLKAVEEETVIYKWKFKISSDFQPSFDFTHVHQIKSVGGDYSSTPMITLTFRKSSPDRLELRYTPTNDQNTLKTADLDLFRGNWVEVVETIKFGDVGSYNIEIKKVSNNEIIFNYNDSSIDMWQDGAEFARPKWGIYRSLKSQQYLKDEEVLFADFSIEEVTETLLVETLKENAEIISLYPNPSSKEVEFKNAILKNYDAVEMYNYTGRKITIDNRINGNKINLSGLSKGLYFVVLKKDTSKVKVLKCIIK